MMELTSKVIEWAEDRNLIEGSTPEKQLEKLAGELIELSVAVAKGSFGLVYSREVAEELGDCLVVLTILAKQLDFELYDCLAIAYDKISKRQGRVIDGKFVKQEDL